MMKLKKKRAVEVPPRIRCFIDNVIATPLENIDEPLTSFVWDFDKGDFHHWIDLFNHFDSYFEKFIKPRKDLQLEDDFMECDPPFPRNGVIQVLRVIRIILENCTNKHFYSSYEQHFASLLASTDADVVEACLQTLATFLKKPMGKYSIRDASFSSRLYSFAQGWGAKEEGLGLVACAVPQVSDPVAYEFGCTLHFEFYVTDSPKEHTGKIESTQGLHIIHVPGLNGCQDTDLEFLNRLVKEHEVPPSLRFSLLTRVRFAKAFGSWASRQQYTRIRLYAFAVLAQASSNADLLVSFFNNEPAFVHDLVALLSSEDAVPEDIRILCVLSLVALCQDRSHLPSVLTSVTSGGHRGVLSSLMHRAVISVMNNNSQWSVGYAESLLSLVTVLVSSSSGCSAMRESGFIPILLPLLKDTDPQHLHLVSTAVHVLEAFMDYFNPAAALFRDLGGLDETISRLKFEVSYIETYSKQREGDLKHKGGEGSELTSPVSHKECRVQPLYSEALVNYYRRLLMKALLRAISLGTYAPGSNARVYGSEESLLPQCLCVIFQKAKEFGGGVFSLAATVMSDLIHKDPTCYPVLEAAGLPTAFMDAIMDGVLCSAEAITAIPQCLDALCLNNNGLQAVRGRSALRCFVKIFTSRAYLRVLAGDVAGSLSAGLDELMRHVSALRAPCVDMLIEILSEIAKMGSISESLTPHPDPIACTTAVPMETDADERKVVSSDGAEVLRNGSSDKTVGSADVSSDNAETLLPEFVNNAARLLETVLHNSEVCRIFVEKKGIEAVLQLFTLPLMPLSSPVGPSVSIAFKNFYPQHSVSLARAICNFFKAHLKSTNESMLSVGGTSLVKIEEPKQATVLRTLFSLEGILCLLNFLLKGTSNVAVAPELGAADSEIIKEIGITYREVLWQISICYDSKMEMDDKKVLNTESKTADATIERDTDEDVRYMNPVAVRSTNRDWDVDREFLSVIRSEGLHRRTRHGLSRVRGGRAGRHLDTLNIDPEVFVNAPETSSHDSNKKNPDDLVLECLNKLASAMRAFLTSLVKGFMVPNRRRAETGALSSSSKSIGAAIAQILYEGLNFQVRALTPGHETPLSVKCRYLGKVVDDIAGLTVDSRKHTCYAAMVNYFYVHGTFKELLTTFAATSQLLWTLFSIPVGVDRVMSGQEGKLSHNSWLLDTLQSYCNALDNFVNSAVILSPSSASHDQLLVQPAASSLSIGLFPVPREPSAFVKLLQSQVLDVVLPVWNHPMFPNCTEGFITSVTSLITRVYSDVGEGRPDRGGIAGMSRRLVAPPPDEATVNTIVEMGFTRARAEEALRRVEMNSVEMAMEWLLAHADDPVQEDDELARALALSLGNESETSKSDSTEKQPELLMDAVAKIPPVDDVISTSTKLLLSNDTLVFTLKDLFVTICNRNKGEDRPRVISHLIQQLRLSASSSYSKETDGVCILSHFLALLVSEDGNARRFVAEYGFTSVAIDMLTSLKLMGESTTEGLTPKCASALLIILDYLLQSTANIPSETTESGQAVEVSKRLADGALPTPNIPPSDPETESCNAFEKILGKSTGYLTYEECCKVLDIACDMIKQHVPAIVMQALLQLCARLTKMHSLAMKFLDGGGMAALFTLPTSCFFAGYDCFASVIIRHLLEDPHTLQTAMESEIRQALNGTGRVTPRAFLTSMAPVISRDPTVFLKAVAATCQLESTGGRTLVVLSKEKEKEKDKQKAPSVDHGLSSNGSIQITEHKTPDGPAKFFKSHKRVPANLAQVFDQLLDIVLKFPQADSLVVHSSSSSAMDVGESVSKAKGKSKVDETLQMEPKNESNDSAALAKVTFVIKLLGDIVLMYGLAAGVILKRDSEVCQLQRVGNLTQGGIINHILHRLLPLASDKSAGSDEWKDKLSEKASWFLVILCGRSSEARRRVLNEIVKGLSVLANVESNSSNNILLPNCKVLAFVELVHSILSKNPSSSNLSGSGFSPDILKTMIDSGIINCLSNIIQVIDLDHPDAPRTTNLILKIIESLTRAANANVQLIKSDGVNKKKTDDLIRANEQRVSFSTAGTNENNQDQSDQPSQIAEITEQPILNSPTEGNNVANLAESADAGNMRIDVNEIPVMDPPTSAMDYVQEDVEQSADLHNSGQFGVQFHVGSGAGVDIGEDDHDMGDNGEDEDDVDDEEEDVAEDGAGMMSLADTDVEDHDDGALGDEYNDEMADEDDDFHENRVIEVRWREALDGLDHLHVLGQPGNNGGLIDVTAEPFEGVNVDDLFGFGRPERRRQTGRASLERSATESNGFNHPLLHRPSAHVGDSSLLQSGGQPSRDVDSITVGVGVGNLEMAHFYMLDAPVLPYDLLPSSLFSDRFSGSAAPALADYSAGVDSLHWSGRRGHGDSRWTDDGRPQTGSHAAVIAQVLELEFLDQMRSFTPSTNQNEPHSENATLLNEDKSALVVQNDMPAVDDATVGPDTEAGNSENATGHQLNQIIENDPHRDLTDNETLVQQEASLHGAVALQPHPIQTAAGHDNPMETGDLVDAAHNDVQTIPSSVTNSSDQEGHQVPTSDFGNISDSGKAQTPEVGCCSTSREDEQMGTDSATLPEASNHNDGSTSLGIACNDVIMGGTETEENNEAHPVISSEHAVTNPSSGQATQGSQDTIQPNNESSRASAIDPTFLEALPDDLRAEVLASQQAQTVDPPTYVPPSIDDIDPEFLAALPPDIQAEVLAQQRAQRIAQQAEGQAVEMDNASIIATFPAELREEVLLTSSEAVLQALPSSLLAEAQMLRDRAMSHYQARGLYGRSHRLTGRRNFDRQAYIDRSVGSIPQRGVSSHAASLDIKEVEGRPFLDKNALRGLVRLLRVAQLLGKGVLQRLLLNLCTHTVTRATLVHLLLDMIKPEVEGSLTTSAALNLQRLYGCQPNVVYGRSPSLNGLPPLVLRRILETLSYLATNHSTVASLLFYFDGSLVSEDESSIYSDGKRVRGKNKLLEGDSPIPEPPEVGDIPLILFLKLLSQPLFLRSMIHLEQLMGLIQVVVSQASSKLDYQTQTSQAPKESQTTSVASSAQENSPRELSESISKNGQPGEVSQKDRIRSVDIRSIFLQLPHSDMHNLCSLLSCDGLSDKVYMLASEVLKKLASVALPLRKFFTSELSSVAQGLSDSAIRELVTFKESQMIGLGASSLTGAAILRVLQALNSIISPNVDELYVTESDAEQELSTIWKLHVALDPLWQELSNCIAFAETQLEQTTSHAIPNINLGEAVQGTSIAPSPPLPTGSQRLLPFIEAFFVLCEKLQANVTNVLQDQGDMSEMEVKESPTMSPGSLSKSNGTHLKKIDGAHVFARFAEKHRRLLNAYIRQNSGLLEKSLSILLKAPRLIDFDNKRSYFRSRIRQLHEHHLSGPLRISVRRAYILEDSYNQLRMRSTQDLKGRLNVQFQGEEGIDAGGLTREWYQLLSRVIFDKGALLFTTVGNNATFQPNPNSVYQTEHLSYFKFVGRLVAKALFDGQLLDVYFTRSFYKHILGVKVTYHDIEAIDPDYYKNLKWMLENDVSDIPDLTFSMDADEEKHILYEKTEVTDYELKPGGRNIRVTEETKHEYVDLVAGHLLTNAIRPQINAFLEGFNELVPSELISIFNDKELELLISGLPEIDLNDLKDNTEYHGYTVASSVVQWFWEVVEAFSKEDMARLLQFVTGTSKVPLEGFKALQGISGPQRFQIHKAYGAPERLPSAHTCFNQLDLPEYTSKEVLQERLLLAIHEASEGFGFG